MKKIPFFLVGNKADMEDQRQVDTLRGEEMAAKYECPFMETSAKTNKNVEEVFHGLVRRVIQSKGSPSGGKEADPSKKGKCVIL